MEVSNTLNYSNAISVKNFKLLEFVFPIHRLYTLERSNTSITVQ